MKAKMIYFSMQMMAMFITSACSNEDDFSDIMESNNLFFAYDHKCFGILLDKSDVKKEDILLKVGIQDINEKGETYYEFI